MTIVERVYVRVIIIVYVDDILVIVVKQNTTFRSVARRSAAHTREDCVSVVHQHSPQPPSNARRSYQLRPQKTSAVSSVCPCKQDSAGRTQ